MNELFLDILNTSFAATWVVLAVVLARLMLKKAPRWLVCALWALVAARLLIGSGIPAPFSVIPSTEIIPPQSLYEQAPVIHSGVAILDNTINPIFTEAMRPMPGASVNPLQVWTAAFANLWILGMALMALWAIVSWVRVRRQVRESIFDNGVYLCDRIASPFIFGLFRPKIYLPSELSDHARAHVIAHESAHLRRRDHWWKPLGFILLTINWFNPAMWLAYLLLCRDIEMACDEKVVQNYGAEEKKAYSTALLRCSVNSRRITACPLAFGEVGVKARVKSVLNYKKPAFWVIVSAVVLIAVLAVRLLTSPVAEDPKQTEVPTTTAKPPSEKASDLGISTHLENITPDGATLVCTQDGTLWHEITTGANWSLQEYRDGLWVDLLPEETVWTTEAYPISTGGSRSFQLNWSHMIGSLEPGRYRISKVFTGYEQRTLYQASKESSTQICMAEFTIGDSIGITLRAENVTQTGLTLVYTHDGDPDAWKEILTCPRWTLERLESGEWVSIMPTKVTWQEVMYTVPVNGTKETAIDFTRYIGSLEPGWYRIGKTYYAHPKVDIDPNVSKPTIEATEETCYASFEINPLGIYLEAVDITPTGATLVCTQNEGDWEHITTGSGWTLEKLTAEGWVSILPEDTAWNAIKLDVNRNGTTSWNLDWSQLAGELEPGGYRVGKTFMGFGEFRVDGTCALGEGIHQTGYAEFLIEQPTVSSQEQERLSDELRQAIQEYWRAYDAMSEFDRLVSSTTPGFGTRDFDDWASVEQFVGQTIPNPLESLDSLEKGNWAAAPEGYNGGARFHISFSGTREGQVQAVNVHSGYRRGDVRIALTAQLSADLRTQPASAYQIISDSGEAYEARTMTVYHSNVEYTLRVIGEPGTGAELISILQELIVYFE